MVCCWNSEIWNRCSIIIALSYHNSPKLVFYTVFWFLWFQSASSLRRKFERNAAQTTEESRSYERFTRHLCCLQRLTAMLRARLHGEFHPGLKFQTGFWNKSSENQVVDYMERDSARGAIQPGLKILARYSQTGLNCAPGWIPLHVIDNLVFWGFLFSNLIRP